MISAESDSKRKLAARYAFKFAISMAALLPLGICGCASLQVHMGMKVRLDKLPLSSMEATMPRGQAIAPGEKSPLVVTFTGSDGKLWVTEGAGKGKVLWRDLNVTASVVAVDKKGNLSLPHDPRKSDGKTAHVEISAPSHPDLHAALDIPLRYDYPFVSSFAGSNGTDGMNGADGSSGMDGTPGSIDPNNPSPGGNGADGSDGSNGGDGGNGGNGPDVQVRVTLRQGAHPMLQAAVLAQGHRERFYLIDPQGGSLAVSSVGGRAGSGGRAGRGGRGGSGGIGSPNGSSGRDGLDGHSGMDGSAGRGGPIAITYDPLVKPYLNALHVASPGGPKPVWQQEPVAPLW